MNFRIDLPVYRGPIDLLLYLVRRQELSLTEMSLAKVVGQYVEYMDLLQELDLGEVGDFLELAATLVEMKSQAVLPQIEDDSDEEVIEESHDALVHKLLQYKEIRDAASVLDEMSARWQTRFERLADDLPSRRNDPADQPIVELEIWDLVSAFGRIMREAAGPPATEVIYDDTPIHVYMQRIHHALADRECVELIDLVEPGQHKSAYIGWFLAMLELTPHHGAAVAENENGDIMVVRTESYQAELNVNEVDNYASGAIDNSNMPIRMR